MIDLKDKNNSPTLEQIGEVVSNPLFQKFCSEIKKEYGCQEKIEYSGCSMEPGWNVKYRKAGKALCTIYPRETYFTVMVVIGKKEKEQAEEVLAECGETMRELYNGTKEGNGQRWLMIDLEDPDEIYQDTLRLIRVRAGRGKNR